MSLTKEDKVEVFFETNQSYSFDRYGEKAWKKSISNLSDLGYTKDEVVWILNSKLMRWAADSFQEMDKHNNPKVLNGSEIIEYKNKYGIKIELEQDNTLLPKSKKNGM